MDIRSIAIDSLKPNPRNARTHSKKQVRQIADSISKFGFYAPIAVDENYMILAGHGRHAAALLLGLSEVPVVQFHELSAAKKRAFALADNKIAENAGWDRQILAVELEELTELLLKEDMDLSITGFAPVEIDQICLDLEKNSSDPMDEIDPALYCAQPVCQPGDLWILGSHRILCGDARNAEHLDLLMDGNLAAMAFLDPPYNVRVRDICGRGKIKHEEFAMASGEMSREQFVDFLKQSLERVADVSRDGAVHFVCMDWRHITELLEAGDAAYGEILNLAVWVKTNAGQGSFYRSQHELIGIFRVGEDQHQNNIELGRHGRYRSNVWQYAGANTFRAGRLEELKAHPTVKPIALVADAMKDCTCRGDILIDSFCGSGTTILAAERVGRRAFAIEIAPQFVDVAIRRWQAFTRKDAIHAASGRPFDAVAAAENSTADARAETIVGGQS